MFRLILRPMVVVGAMALCGPAVADGPSSRPTTAPATQPATMQSITPIDPPEGGFYAKQLDFEGILIKSSARVVDEALVEARRRLATQLEHLPQVRSNLAARGAELHIIGRDEQPSDLPELRQYKDKPWDGGPLTIDQRTRGVGGLMTSCGEENLLKLEKDRYRGRDICIHEFAHNIRNYGIPRGIREKFDQQRKASMDKGLWVGSYAASNDDEFFAELSMWYFGTHGDMRMRGTKPKDGPDGLREYDPDAFALFDDFYSGRMDIPPVEPRRRGR
jgi:hypothetical protein